MPVATAGIKGFLETSFVDWPGRIAAVVFLPFCNFRCPYCHNRELVEGAERLPDIPLDFILRKLERLKGWVDGVVISGGEPTLWPGLPGLAGAFRRAGLRVKLDTNGSRPAVLAGLLGRGLVQQVDMDVKAPLEQGRYTRVAGVPADLDAIAESMSTIAASGIPHRFRTTYVPELLDRDDLAAISSKLPASSPFVLQAFRPGRTLDPLLTDSLPPDSGEMALLRELVARPAAA